MWRLLISLCASVASSIPRIMSDCGVMLRLITWIGTSGFRCSAPIAFTTLSSFSRFYSSVGLVSVWSDLFTSAELYSFRKFLSSMLLLM